MARLVLDANLIVLLVVGDVDPREIALHKRLQSYDAGDYDLLIRVVNRFATTVTFPNLLTEASNLVRQCPEYKRARFGAALAIFAHNALETFQPSRDAVGHSHYLRLGLTDAAILNALTSNDHLLTVDLDLYLSALSAGLVARNFSHLRNGSYQD